MPRTYDERESYGEWLVFICVAALVVGIVLEGVFKENVSKHETRPQGESKQEATLGGGVGGSGSPKDTGTQDDSGGVPSGGQEEQE